MGWPGRPAASIADARHDVDYGTKCGPLGFRRKGPHMTSAARGDALLLELGELLDRLDPMPPGLVDQARQVLCWGSIDAELAELSFDSLLDRELALAVRSADDSVLEPRMLGFATEIDGDDVCIEVEVSATDGQ